MPLPRLARIVKLLGLLQGGRPHNVDQLADALEISRRTVFRDLAAVREAGAPIAFDDDTGRYRLTAGYFPGAGTIDTAEAAALATLCHELGRGSALPFMDKAAGAAAKLVNALPPSVRQRVRNLTSGIEIRVAVVSPTGDSRARFEALAEALAARKSVRVTYQGPLDEKPVVTKLSPYRLVFQLHAWYCVGRSSIHRAVRTFHVGRIAELVPLDESYRVPKGFSLKRHFRNAWRMIPEPGRDQRVVVRFAPPVAKNVAEVAWHPKQKTAFDPDGSLRFEVVVSGLHEICWWILGYGDRAEVIEPEPLRRMIAEHAANLLDRYATKAPRSQAGS